MALPVGTILLTDTLSSGTWVDGRVPNASYLSTNWTDCALATVTGGEVLGTNVWSSGLPGYGELQFASALDTTGYVIEIDFRVNAAAGMPPTGYWDGFTFAIDGASGYGDTQAQSGILGGAGGGPPELVVWEPGSAAYPLTGVANINGGGAHTLRVEVGTLRQDYYWDGVLKHQTAAFNTRQVTWLRFSTGYSNCAISRIHVETIADIAPEVVPPTEFWSDFLGTREDIG